MSLSDNKSAAPVLEFISKFDQVSCGGQHFLCDPGEATGGIDKRLICRAE